MTSLTNPATGHTVKTTAESVDFWTAAGYREEKPAKAPAKKAAAKKSTAKKS